MITEQVDSEFGLAVVESVVKFKPCKEALAKAGEKLNETIVRPILEKLTKHVYKNEEEMIFSNDENQTIEFLIREHSKDGMQWGGCMREHAKKEIAEDNKLKVKLLEKISCYLSFAIEEMDNKNKLAYTMKAITDCCFCYVEYVPSEKKGSDYINLKTKLMPISTELAMRIPYEEVAFEPHIATSFGSKRENNVIPKTERDKIPDSERMDQCGKSQFAGIDFLALIGRVIWRYVFAHADYEREKDETFSLETRQMRLKDLKKWADFMDSFGIPLLEEERRFKLGTVLYTCLRAAACHFGETAKVVCKISPNAIGSVPPDDRHAALDFFRDKLPRIQQLALSRPELADQLPLIASSSGTTARTLIALQNMRLFTKNDETFDVEIAQYMAIALCGTLVYGGHHSVLEVGDIYNRLLEYHADASTAEYMYKPGDYISFVAKEMLINGNNLPVNEFCHLHSQPASEDEADSSLTP